MIAVAVEAARSSTLPADAPVAIGKGKRGKPPTSCDPI
jgi:hypothetical protein